ncbi:MAG: NAD(P)H-hydrate dehydratase [Thermodesulfovibrio sp.]|nr:NAD(P)H-hydrate dehydratase [Thermodesulfovibrio sp.]
MKVVNSQEMTKIDSLTINQYGIPSFVLMERAALAVANHILKRKPKDVVVIAGPGNNGGDGIALSRILKDKVRKIKVFLPFSEDKLSEDCKNQIKIALNFGVPIVWSFPSEKDLLEADFIVDAIFGTGLKRDIEGELRDFIERVNSLKKFIVSIDIPSGVSSDTGQILGAAIKADLTITFGALKRGHLLYPGRDFVGQIFVEDIGFPKELLDEIKVHIIDKDFAKTLVPPRPKYSHKGKYGHLLIVAGSVGKTGAALMTAKAALRSGSGLVTLAVPSIIDTVFQANVFEEMILSLPSTAQTLSKSAIPEILSFIIDKANCVAFGPGVGVNEDIEEILKSIILQSPYPLVIDADGITVLSKIRDILKEAKSEIVLTPHPGELSRLINLSVKEIEKNRVDITKQVAEEFKVVVVLKGVPTVISNPEGLTFINTTGNPGMATAGSGDVLTGIIGSLIGQGVKSFYAAVLGVYLHGLSGDIASKDKGFHGLVAGDIIESIPKAFLELTDASNSER